MKTLVAAVFAASIAWCEGAGAAGMPEAMHFYESGQYIKAAEALRSAAEGGDVRAAEMLGFMHAFGPSMYPGIQRDVRSALTWFDRAARQGSPIGRYMVCAMRQQLGAGVPKRQVCFDWVAETGVPPPR